MPRPGPRPYECVRRAWHSERHQPMRGSLIQEIFRLATEVHKQSTRENEEWLEKLPLVVIKVEEIMYSKANSEEEYMDPKSIWDRANDAIDTIIRREDTSENEGDLLQPCIEAALNLGCIPRRASRSQRHDDPICYLRPVNNKVHHWFESWYSAFMASNKLIRSSHEVNSLVVDGSLERKDSTSNAMHDFIGSDGAKGDLNTGLNFGRTSKRTPDRECDLSLRLGLFPPPQASGAENAWTHEIEDVESSS